MDAFQMYLIIIIIIIIIVQTLSLSLKDALNRVVRAKKISLGVMF